MATAFTTFYINLDRHENRRRFIEAELAAAQIEAERVRGIEGANVPPHLARYFFPANGRPCRLSAGQIGVSASHFEVMRQVKARGIAAALVLEDDARISPDLREILADLLEKLPGGWDLVRLCRHSKRAMRPIAELPGGRRLVRYSRVPLGRAGYLVSQNGAEKLLTPRSVYAPGDVEIAHPWLLDLDIFGVDPPPITQERRALPSTIGRERGRMSRLRRAAPDPRRLVFNIRKLGLVWWLRCGLANATRKLR